MGKKFLWNALKKKKFKWKITKIKQVKTKWKKRNNKEWKPNEKRKNNKKLNLNEVSEENARRKWGKRNNSNKDWMKGRSTENWSGGRREKFRRALTSSHASWHLRRRLRKRYYNTTIPYQHRPAPLRPAPPALLHLTSPCPTPKYLIPHHPILRPLLYVTMFIVYPSSGMPSPEGRGEEGRTGEEVARIVRLKNR